MAYGNLAGWRAYALARGDSAPTNATDADANAALLRGQDYIQYSYVERFVSPYDETANNVEEAHYEASNLELATPGFFNTQFTADQQKVLTGAGSIKWTPVGVKDSTERSGQLATPRSTLIDAMLAAYMPVEKGIAPYMATIGAPA